MYSFDTVKVDIDEGVATVTLNRPERLNAINDAMAEEFVAAFQRLGRDYDVRAMVLTGSGRGFCSGADISGTTDVKGESDRHRGFEGRRHLADSLQRMPLAIRAVEKPVIAAVNGIAAGGGFDLACACDIRCGSTSARFSEIFAKRGLFPGTGGCYLLPRLVGTAKAAEMIWLGTEIDAEQALGIGLLSYIFDSDKFLEMARAYAKKFADGPPLAISLAKASIYASEHMDFSTALNYAATAESITMTSMDRAEGGLAFRERRAPRFTGR